MALEPSLQAMCAPFTSSEASSASAAQKSEFSAAEFRHLVTQFGDNPFEEDECNSILGAVISGKSYEPQQKHDTSSDAMITTSAMDEWLGSDDSNEDGDAMELGLNIESALRLLAGPGGSFDYDSMSELLSSPDGETRLREEEIRNFLDEVQASGKDAFSLDNLTTILKTDKGANEPDECTPRRTSSPLHNHPELTGLYTDAIKRGAFKKPQEGEMRDLTPRRTCSPLHNHPDLTGTYAEAIKRGAFKYSQEGAKNDPSKDTPRALSPLYDHAMLSGSYKDAIERGAFKKLTVEPVPSGDDDRSPRASSPLHNALQSIKLSPELQESSEANNASSNLLLAALESQAGGWTGSSDAIERGAFKKLTAEPVPSGDDYRSPRASSPLHNALQSIKLSPELQESSDAIERSAFKKLTVEPVPSGDDYRSPRASSPLHNHPGLSGTYSDAIERGAFKQPSVGMKLEDEASTSDMASVDSQVRDDGSKKITTEGGDDADKDVPEREDGAESYDEYDREYDGEEEEGDETLDDSILNDDPKGLVVGSEENADDRERKDERDQATIGRGKAGANANADSYDDQGSYDEYDGEEEGDPLLEAVSDFFAKRDIQEDPSEILDEYDGREEELFKEFLTKYGSQPDFDLDQL